MFPRPPWTYEEPACKENPELFFLHDKDEQLGEGEEAEGDYIAAKEVCRNLCPHLKECGAWAVLHEGFGVWGGMSPHDRSSIRRSRNIILDSQPIFIR